MKNQGTKVKSTKLLLTMNANANSNATATATATANATATATATATANVLDRLGRGVLHSLVRVLSTWRRARVR